MNTAPDAAFKDTTPGKEALRLWLRLLSCESLVEQHVRSNLRREFGITLPQFDVLAKLDYRNHPMTMSELSNHLMVSNGNITGVVDRLVRDGYVERQASPGDRRVQLISLSDRGRREFQRMARCHESWIGDAFEDISVDEIRDITRLLGMAGEKLKNRFGKTSS